MPYVLPDTFLPDLRLIRKNYEDRTNIDLNKASKPYKVTKFFGATDVSKRQNQIKFIEVMLVVLNHDLLQPLDSIENIQKYFEALRVLVAICIYITSEIDETYHLRQVTNSTLATLINEALKLDDKNPLDEETRTCCLYSAQLFINKHPLNLKDPYSRSFLNYITNHCKAYEDTNVPNSYPITSILTPTLSVSMGLIGNTMGFIAGDAIGKSTFFLSTRYTITTALGSGILLIVGPGANMGVLLLAPSVAGKLLDRFCGLTLGGLMGIIMSAVGSGAGWAIGRTLDSAWSLFYQACCILVRTNSEQPLPPLTGFTLVDPHRIIDGCEITESESQEHFLENTEEYEKFPVLLSTNEGKISIRIREEEVKPDVDSNNPLYQAVIDQLKGKQREENAAEPVVDALAPS